MEDTPFYDWLMNEMHLSKNLYNKILYIYRQAYNDKLENIPEYLDAVQKIGEIEKTDKDNNKKKVNIPFNMLINMIDYKAQEVGGQVITFNESHTSKCSFLDNEDICHHDKYVGNRTKRGLFKSSTGKKINADINASLNIIRRGFKINKMDGVINNNNIFNPVKIEIENANGDAFEPIVKGRNVKPSTY